MIDHHQGAFALYWKNKRDTSILRTLLFFLLALSFSLIVKAQGQDRIILPSELEIKLDKIIAVEEQLIAANFPMVGFEGKQSLSKIREKKDAGTLTEEEAEAYMATILEIVKQELNALAELLKPQLDPTLSFEEGLIKRWEGGDEERALEGEGHTLEEAEDACLAPYPRVAGRREGETIVTEAGSGRIKGEPQTCTKLWYYYLGPKGGYQPILRDEVVRAETGWYSEFDYKTILRNYGMALAIALGDVNSPVINANYIDETSAALVYQFQDGRELAETFEVFVSRNYSYFLNQAEREFSGSGEIETVYPIFNVLDILAGGGLSGLRAITRQVSRRGWLHGGRHIRRIAPEAPIKVGNEVVEITNQQGEVLFKVKGDELEITSKAFLPEGEEVVFREKMVDDLPLKSGNGEDLTGQIELVKTKRGNLHVEVVTKTGDDLFSAFNRLDKLSDETKSVISSKGWSDEVLQKLDDDLGTAL